MSDHHLEFTFSLSPRDPFADILTAELAEAGFEMFVETPEGIKAYLSSGLDAENILDGILILKDPSLWHSLKIERIEKQNWNEEWEKNFPVVEIGEQLLIRAPFHEPGRNKYCYEIVIEPKMSFGTGHHDTTFLMAQQLLELDVQGKRVLDMGCGTGILGILAAKKGAASVVAIDIEEWAYENAKENAERNAIFNISVEKGDVNLLAGRPFQLILANINKNVLLNDLGAYSNRLEAKGELLLSGFFESDAGELAAAAGAQGLICREQKARNGWAMMYFTKPGL
ncbi:MAG TPA: 50S ribosomal protein L11 methyltransferase [Bacteroidia bacterium]